MPVATLNNPDPAAGDSFGLAVAISGTRVVVEGGFLTLTIAKRAGVTYLAESAASPDDAAFSAATTTILTDDATTLKVRDNFPVGTSGLRTMRLKVTGAP